MVVVVVVVVIVYANVSAFTAIIIVSNLSNTTPLLIVRHILWSHQFPGSMGMQIITHIIALHLHIIAKLVKGGSTDLVALAIHLPSDRCIGRTNLVAIAITGGRSAVHGDILAHAQCFVNNPSAD